MMHRLILLRHGESEYNATQIFTGLLDVDLSTHGRHQVTHAADLILAAHLNIGMVVSSPMVRAIHTVDVLSSTLVLPAPHLTWRLSERDYGAMTGVSKSECRRRWGDENFFTWRRTVDGKPPAASAEQVASWGSLASADLGPLKPGASESLRDVIVRVAPLWRDIASVLFHTDVLVVAHGNSLRALIALIEDLAPDAIERLNIAGAQPLVYTFDDAIPSSHYLDSEAGAAGASAVAAEGGT